MHRDLLEQLHWGAVEINHNAVIQWVNPFFEEMTGYSSKELKGKNVIEFFLQNLIDRKQSFSHLQSLKENKTVVFEVRMAKFNGELMDLVINAVPFKNSAGKIVGSIGFYWDITPVKQQHRQIEEKATDLRNAFLKESIIFQEKHKESFGSLLYNEVLSKLTFAGLYLQKAALNDKINEQLNLRAQKKIHEAINDIRDISLGLMPTAFNLLGMKEAILDLINRYNSIQNTYFVLFCNLDDLKDVEFNAQRNIFRITEELIKNAVTHAKASTVIIKFKRDNNNLSLIVKDNGVGFNQQSEFSGLGLKNIKNITTLYSGTINIKTGENKGTSFTVCWPIEKLCSVFSKNTDDIIAKEIQHLRNKQ